MIRPKQPGEVWTIRELVVLLPAGTLVTAEFLRHNVLTVDADREIPAMLRDGVLEIYDAKEALYRRPKSWRDPS